MPGWKLVLVLVAVPLVGGCVSRQRYEEETRRTEQLQEALKAQRTELAGQLRQREQRIGELEETLRLREEALRLLNDRLDTSESRLRSALERVGELDDDRSRGQARIKALEEELSKLQGGPATLAPGSVPELRKPESAAPRRRQGGDPSSLGPTQPDHQ